jgi:hypothetical protein
MVSYRHIDALHCHHSTRLSEASLTGVFKQVVFRASNLYNGPFFSAPTIPVPTEAGAPRTFAEGMLAVLIGDLPVLESAVRNPTSAQ